MADSSSSAASASTADSSAGDAAAIANALMQITQVIRGNDATARMAFAAVLAGGHVLLEDVPGVGKTTLARALARVLGCSFARIQFTADLLPSDLIGVQMLDAKSGTLHLRKGPLFSHVVLADEINRASPKTQSALLEAMADHTVSIDDETHALPPPFVVIATQNPVEHHGAYPLPESQLDRFLVSLKLGYPPAAEERALLVNNRTADAALPSVTAVFTPVSVHALQQRTRAVAMNDAVAGYLLALVDATRTHPALELGCSPRGSLAWASLCRALALLDGRAFTLPDDVKATAHAVLCHRIVVRGLAEGAEARRRAISIVDDIVSQTPAPR